jgi:hypothetical protein
LGYITESLVQLRTNRTTMTDKKDSSNTHRDFFAGMPLASPPGRCDQCATMRSQVDQSASAIWRLEKMLSDLRKENEQLKTDNIAMAAVLHEYRSGNAYPALQRQPQQPPVDRDALMALRLQADEAKLEQDAKIARELQEKEHQMARHLARDNKAGEHKRIQQQQQQPQRRNNEPTLAMTQQELEAQKKELRMLQDGHVARQMVKKDSDDIANAQALAGALFSPRAPATSPNGPVATPGELCLNHVAQQQQRRHRPRGNHGRRHYPGAN